MPLKIGALEVPNLSDTKVQLTQNVWLGHGVPWPRSPALSLWVRASPDRPDNRGAAIWLAAPCPGRSSAGPDTCTKVGFSTTSPATPTWSPRH